MKKTTITTDTMTPTLDNGISHLIQTTVADYLRKNTDIADKIENVSIKINIEPYMDTDIDWNKYVGQMIQVADINDEQESWWSNRILYAYDPNLSKPFICWAMDAAGKPDKNICTWTHARLIANKEVKEPEIDWSKVQGAKVYISDLPGNLNSYCSEEVIFMGYFPSLNYPFWVFDCNKKDSAKGYKYCKLAEPIKPEWIKK